MQLWEWVISADRKYDLADTTAAVAWFAHVPNRQVSLRVKWDKDPRGPQPWPRPIVAKWRKAFHALRSLVPRLRGHRCRATHIDPLEADRVFQQYLLRLVVHVRQSGPTDRPLHAKTFQGVWLNPGVMSVEDYPAMPLIWGQVAMVMDGFWRQVFASLATDQIPPVCAGCGQPLAKTPGGRTPRADRCKRCRFKAWYTKQPKTQLRKRWRANKAAERARGNHKGEE